MKASRPNGLWGEYYGHYLTTSNFGFTCTCKGPEVKLDLMMFAAMKSVDTLLDEMFSSAGGGGGGGGF